MAITIAETDFDITRNRKGRLAIFTHTGQGNPEDELGAAIASYCGFNEKLVVNGDDGVKIVISNHNEIRQAEFDPRTHRLIRPLT